MKLDVAILTHGRIIPAFTELSPEIERDLPERFKEHITTQSDPFGENGGGGLRPRSRRGMFELNKFYPASEMPSPGELLEDQLREEAEQVDEAVKEAVAEAQENYAANVAQQKYARQVAAEAGDAVAERAVAESEAQSAKADWEGHRPMHPETGTDEVEDDAPALRPKLEKLKPKLRPKPKRRRRK